ncbi:MAG: hypothetical protein IH974_01040 [Myxococcales bacterium]|nr:hypothetical protein [Myxococcales bacterium]
MIGLRRILAITSALSLAVFLFPAGSASADPSLYYGSIRIILSYGASSTYSIPFGANISYPHMDNLPAGNIATVSGSAPAAIGLGANQITLHTSLFTTSPPTSWYGISEVLSTFSGGHDAGSFFENGAPGAASSAPLSGIPASQFGVTFKGTPGRFGGTLALLGNHRTRWGKVVTGHSSRFCAGFSFGEGSTCSIWNRPISPIGGAFGGSAFGRGWIWPSGTTPNFFDQTLWGFPWTTGTVTARAPLWSGGTTSLVFKGTDQRTPAGAGNIQLVTPLVIRYTEDLHDSPPVTWYQAGVAIVDLQFVPEPSALLVLASGMLALAGLFRHSRRAG